jgi:hypothetical protein
LVSKIGSLLFQDMKCGAFTWNQGWQTAGEIVRNGFGVEFTDLEAEQKCALKK